MKNFISSWLVGVFILTASTMSVPASIFAQTLGDELSREASVEDILWLARILNSETDRPEEQVMIAWVVRNRVESGFRGSTYKEVALSSSQFSGLNPFDRKYGYNISRTFGHDDEVWQKSLSIAETVYNADPSLRPFSREVRHFYSPVSVKRAPSWAEGREPMLTFEERKTGEVRFAFFEGIE